jgi:hypothetical protein
MPKNRKETYSDRQSSASRAKKKATSKNKQPKEDVNQTAARILKEATKG